MKKCILGIWFSYKNSIAEFSCWKAADKVTLLLMTLCMAVPGSGINFLCYPRRLDQGGSFWAMQVENISEL